MLLESSKDTFTTSASFQNPTSSVFAPDFGAQWMTRKIQIMNMPSGELTGAWNRCIENAFSAKASVEDELEKPRLANVGPFPDGPLRSHLRYSPDGKYQTDVRLRTVY